MHIVVRENLSWDI